MLRRVVYLLSIGCAVASLTACGSSYKREQREPWRAEVEAQCLASGKVQETAGIRFTQKIAGPGVCGLDHPLRVSALEVEGNQTQFAALGAAPRAQSAAPYPQPATPDTIPAEDLPAEDFPAQAGTPAGLPPSDLPMGSPILPPADITGQIATSPMPYAATGGNGRSSVSLDQGLILSCSMIPVMKRWLTSEVQPAAIAAFGSPVVEVTTFGSYSCRRRLNKRTGRMSEHAFGNAVDIKGFKLADGRETRILRGWRGTPAEQSFWRDVTYGACRNFMTVLGPGSSDGQHENHLHLDMARLGSKRRMHICRPRVPSDWVALARRGSGMPAEEFTGSIIAPMSGDEDE